MWALHWMEARRRSGSEYGARLRTPANHSTAESMTSCSRSPAPGLSAEQYRQRDLREPNARVIVLTRRRKKTLRRLWTFAEWMDSQPVSTETGRKGEHKFPFPGRS